MRKNRKNSGNFTTFLLVILLLVGLSLLLYPSVSDYWNSFHSSVAITQYAEQVAGLDEHQYDALWDAAADYNASLLERSNTYLLGDDQKQQYSQLLNVSGTGVMGYIEIPSIQCSLPIYHGTDESVLQVAVGHLEWSSLPVGGESTHCVLSGHRGLPSAKLFTNLDKLVIGDVFLLRVLDEVLTYEVDQILIVEPQETAALKIVEGQDYCTLVTCTPYGVNSHRLLVRGHRIELQQETVQQLQTEVQKKTLPLSWLIILAILYPLLIILLFFIIRKRRK